MTGPVTGPRPSDDGHPADQGHHAIDVQPATAEQTSGPSVRTAPARAGHWWAAVPRHLGRARTSTIVLAVLWIAIFVLYIYVRPDTSSGAATTGNQAPVAPATHAPAPTTTHPASTTPTSTTPTRTSSEPATPSSSSSAPGRSTSSTGAGTVPTTSPSPSGGAVLPTGAPTS